MTNEEQLALRNLKQVTDNFRGTRAEHQELDRCWQVILNSIRLLDEYRNPQVEVPQSDE